MGAELETETKGGRYHHGDLRNALVQAALAMLEQDGLDRLTLRGVAAAVGVSHAAPGHHFGTLTGLRTALAAIGHVRFGASMRAERAAVPGDAAAQMRAARRGYLSFAMGQPALFRLMGSSPLLDWSDPELGRAAAAARAELTAICAPAADRLGLTTDEARRALEHLVWSEVHGYALLRIDGQIADVMAVPPSPDLAALLFGGEDGA
jgi:AcrR family transcriptional regulator